MLYPKHEAEHVVFSPEIELAQLGREDAEMTMEATVVRMSAEAVVVQCPYGRHMHAHKLGEVALDGKVTAKCSSDGKRCYYVDLGKGLDE